MSRLASVRNLFAGSALVAPPENDDDKGAGASEQPKQPVAAGPTQAQVEAVVADSVKAESDRWNKVISSDAGAANPKAAAKLLTMAGGASSADEVIAALGDIGAAPPAKAPDANADRSEADRAALAGNADTRVDTGAAGGGTEQRRGEGDDGRTATVREKRAARAERQNKSAAAAGGRRVNAA